MNTVVFIDDAHTFGGAQVAMCSGIDALTRRTSLDVVCITTALTWASMEKRLAHSQRVRFLECQTPGRPTALKFLLRVPWYVETLRSVRNQGVASWWLNLSGIEFNLAALAALRLMNQHPRSWLHNPERFASFSRVSRGTPRAIDEARDTFADRVLFAQHPYLLTASITSLEAVLRRAPQLKRDRVSYLYPPIGPRSQPSATRPAPKEVKLWMVGRVEFTTKNNAAVLKLAAHLRAQGHVVSVSVVGDGPDLPRFKGLAIQLHLDAVTKYYGWLDRPWEHVSPDALVVVPSHYESAGLVGTEALLHGHRLVASPIPTFREQLPSVVVAESFEIEAFAEKTLEVLRLPQADLDREYASRLEKLSEHEFVRRFLEHSGMRAEATRG